MYSLYFQKKLFLHKKIEKLLKGMTAPMKKITWCVIYLIKVNYTSYNYTSYKSTWTLLPNKSKLHIVQLNVVQKYMDIA